MKKIILAVALATLGIAANAAVANWTMDNIYSPGTTSYGENFLVYYFDTSSISDAVATSKLAGGDVSFVSLGYAADDATDDEGYAEGRTPSIYNAGDAVNGYLVIFNSSDVSTATLAYVTGVESTVINNLGSNVSLDFGNITSAQNASNWTTVAAPEPTSGLLLLLGMAGLALKRKRA